MQLHQLAYFVAVVEERSFTRAAERCHVAQPSLSQQVRALEREVGQSLVDRARGAVGPTEAGERLLPYARRMLSDAAAATEELRRLQGLESGRLRVGATPSVATGLLPPLLARFSAAHPRVVLQVAESGSRDLVERLAVGGLDVAVVVLPVSVRGAALATTPLLRDGLVLTTSADVAVPPSGPLSGRSVDVAELADVPLVLPREGYDLREQTLAAFHAVGVVPRVVAEGGEMDTVVALVRAGLGAAVLPRTVVRGAPLRTIPLRDPAMHRTIGVAHRKDVPLSRAAQEMRRLLLEHTAWSGA